MPQTFCTQTKEVRVGNILKPDKAVNKLDLKKRCWIYKKTIFSTPHQLEPLNTKLTHGNVIRVLLDQIS